MVTVIWTLLTVVAAADDSASDFRSNLDQAKFFIRKKWYEDALEQLQASVQHEDGRIDPEAWYLLATVRYELADLEGARKAAERAHSFSRDDNQLEQASALAAFLREQFGVVRLTNPHEGVVTKLDVQLTSLLFDPGLKAYLTRLAERTRGDMLLPHRIGLPAGTYDINGSQVVVTAGEEVSVDVTVLSKAPLALQVAQVEVSTGLSTWFGPRVSNMLPAATLQLAVTQPVGPLMFGLHASWEPRPYNTATRGVALSPTASSVGFRLGRDLPGLNPLVLRPSIGYRFAVLPGVEVPCEAGIDSWTCGESADPELLIYTVGRMHIPYVEVAAHYLEMRRRGLGVGLKLIGELGVGSVPRSATAESWEESADQIPYVVEDGRQVIAGGLQVLVNLSIAL
jgi:hypothetical protein